MKNTKVSKEGYKRFEAVWDKQVEPNSLIVVEKGKTVKADDINLRKLIDDVITWSKRSCKGLCCGVYGCKEDVISRCIECKGGYCDDHERSHIHRAKEQGFLPISHSHYYHGE